MVAFNKECFFSKPKSFGLNVLLLFHWDLTEPTLMYFKYNCFHYVVY